MGTWKVMGRPLSPPRIWHGHIGPVCDWQGESCYFILVSENQELLG